MTRRPYIVPAEIYEALCAVAAAANLARHETVWDSHGRDWAIKALNDLHAVQPVLGQPKKDAA